MSFARCHTDPWLEFLAGLEEKARRREREELDIQLYPNSGEVFYEASLREIAANMGDRWTATQYFEDCAVRKIQMAVLKNKHHPLRAFINPAAIKQVEVYLSVHRKINQRWRNPESAKWR